MMKTPWERHFMVVDGDISPRHAASAWMSISILRRELSNQALENQSLSNTYAVVLSARWYLRGVQITTTC